MKMNRVGIVTGVETIRPLRIATNARELSRAPHMSAADAATVKAAADEIERLYHLLNDALDLGAKACDVARS